MQNNRTKREDTMLLLDSILGVLFQEEQTKETARRIISFMGDLGAGSEQLSAVKREFEEIYNERFDKIALLMPKERPTFKNTSEEEMLIRTVLVSSIMLLFLEGFMEEAFNAMTIADDIDSAVYIEVMIELRRIKPDDIRKTIVEWAAEHIVLAYNLDPQYTEELLGVSFEKIKKDNPGKIIDLNQFKKEKREKDEKNK